MPYIQKHVRFYYDREIDELLKSFTDGQYPHPGDLNYILTRIIKGYYKANGNENGAYQSINDILGALEGAKMEFYRRVVVPYEDGKIKQNGDVY